MPSWIDFQMSGARKRGKPMDFRQLNRSPSWKREVAAQLRNQAESLPTQSVFHGACPICGSDARQPVTEVYGYRYLQCEPCGHIYSERYPAPAALESIYKSTADKPSVQNQFYVGDELFLKRVNLIAQPKVDHISEVCGKTGRWVDIGAGSGEIIFCAKKMGFQEVGIDSDGNQIAFARTRGLEMIQTFLDEVKTREHSDLFHGADIVSLFNFLEHIPRPRELLKDVTQYMRAGAYLVFEVPRHPSMSSLSCMAFPEFASRHIYMPEHLHVFTEKSAARMIEECGFEAKSVWTYGQDFFEVVCGMMTKSESKDSAFLEKLLQMNEQIQGVIDAHSMSDNMIVIAKKL